MNVNVATMPMELPDSKKFPEGIPDQREREENLWEVEFNVREVTRYWSKEETREGESALKKHQGVPDCEFDLFDTGGKKVVIVSLSWKKNYKSVTNWMRKHMEAYPETVGGFFVEFIDWGREWYVVLPCKPYEKWEEIGWVNYKILPYVFEFDSEKLSEFTDSVRREMFEFLKLNKRR